MNENRAFTLAEVLITLVIIGVVAAITIPSLQQKIQEDQYKIAYKKAFSTASQAWEQAVHDNLMTVRNSASADAANNTNFAAFKSKFKVSKDCNSNNNSACWSNQASDEKWDIVSDPDGYPTSNAPAFIDNSGMAWSLANSGHSYMFVDTNGFKKPNKWGRDRFMFVADDHKFDGNITLNIIPPAIKPRTNQIPVDKGSCPSGNCYYSSWLFN